MLPREILCEIFKWCEHRDLARWMRVCKQFNRVIRYVVSQIKYDDPYTPFRCGMYLIIDKLLDPLSNKLFSWQRALRITCICGYTGIVRKMLTCKPDIRRLEIDVIHHLCSWDYDRIGMIRLLIEFKCNTPDDWIIAAIKYSRPDTILTVISELEQHNVAIDWDLLMKAACISDGMWTIELIEAAMIKRSLRINWNAGLHIACNYGHVEVINYIENAAKRHSYNLDWHTARNMALLAKELDIARLVGQKLIRPHNKIDSST